MMNTTANTHPAGAEPVPSDNARKSTQEDDSNPRKEKSVLQAKLTKLAIQIGYAGMIDHSVICHEFVVLTLWYARSFQVLQSLC